MACKHFKDIKSFQPAAPVCEECVKIGSNWVHLRMCLSCGKVGCCDSSPNRHASAHFAKTSHPVIRSIEPREAWAWCYVDKEYGDDLNLAPIDWDVASDVRP